jgi:general secretion pathway protein A
VLVGQPELRERIARIPQLAQRVAIQHHIDYLDRAETKAYILARLAAAGGESAIFSPSAMSSIYHCTGGVCRLINSLCDLCLYFGCVSGAPQIRHSLVEKVAHEALPRRTHGRNIRRRVVASRNP